MKNLTIKHSFIYTVFCLLIISIFNFSSNVRAQGNNGEPASAQSQTPTPGIVSAGSQNCSEENIFQKRAYAWVLRNAARCLRQQAGDEDAIGEEHNREWCRTIWNGTQSAILAVDGVVGYVAARSIARFRSNPTAVDEPGRPRIADIDTDATTTPDAPNRRPGLSVGGGLTATALAHQVGQTLLYEATQRTQQWYENWTGTSLYGDEFLCPPEGRAGPIPIVERAPGATTCRVDWSDPDAVVEALADDNTLMTLTRASSTFCDELDRFLVRLYADIVNENTELAGNVQMVGRPDCDGDYYEYYLEVTPPDSNTTDTYFINYNPSRTETYTDEDGEIQTIGPGLFEINNTNNNQFDTLVFELNSDDPSNIENRYPILTRLANSPQVIPITRRNLNGGNATFGPIDGIAAALAGLDGAFLGSVARECCTNRPSCTNLGVAPGGPTTMVGDPEAQPASE